MIVPQYWAEARIQQRIGKRQITVRRFGWSDASQQAAQDHAQQRVQEAYDRVAAGEKLERREPKVAYHGTEGLPIREEVLARHGSSVITRNSYGAHCLNTPDVLFADIDFDTDMPDSHSRTVIGVALACAVLAGWREHSWITGIIFFVALMFAGYRLASYVHRYRLARQGGPEGRARARITQFSQDHPDWHLRLYRTPAGLRLLAMHRTFDPVEPAVDACFDALGADPVFKYMCRNQHCFRARLTAKPWRIGVEGHMRPRPGVWPINPERMPARNAWIARYEAAALGYAACEFIEAIGSSSVDPQAQAVQELHDALCRATSGLPIA